MCVPWRTRRCPMRSWTPICSRSGKTGPGAPQPPYDARACCGKAQAALPQLTVHKQGKPVYRDADSLQQAAQALLKAQQVQGLIRLQIDEQVEERRVRAYGTHPAAVRVERSFHLHSEVDQAAVSAATRRLGWRVYMTNHPEQTLSLEQAVLAYREEYLVERGVWPLERQAALALAHVCAE